MHKIFFYGVIGVGLTLAACNQKAAAPKADETMATDQKKVNIKLADLATNKDLNCEMPLSEGDIADTTTYQGKIYGFCSAECKTEFLKDPQAKLDKK